MLNKYHLASHLGYHALEDGHSLLIDERSWRIIRDPLLSSMLKAMHSRPHSIQEVLEIFSSTFQENDIVSAFDQLKKAMIIGPGPTPTLLPEQEVHLLNLGFDPLVYSTALRDFRFSIHVHDQEVAEWMLSPLESAGLVYDPDASFQIWMVKDPLDTRLREVNSHAIASRSSWIMCKPFGSKPLFSPIFTPHEREGKCWECLYHFYSLQDQAHQLFHHLPLTSTSNFRPVGRHPAVSNIVLSRLAIELQSWLLEGKESKIANNLFSLDARKGNEEWHSLTKRPQCSTCGDPTLLQNPPEPIVVSDVSVHPQVPGGYRTVLPEETLNRYSHLVSPITGVLPFIRPYGQSPHSEIHNFASGRNIAMESKSMFWLNMHMRSTNGGKGKTALQAKVGALCEAVERYCGIYPGPTYTIKGNLSNIRQAVHPNTCMLYSDQQLKSRNLSNETATKFFSIVPIPFDEKEEMEWTPVFSLTHSEFKYLPSCFCYAQYPAKDEKQLYAYPDSNGGAAGNTIEEAILQGFLELVERDGAAIWWYNRLQRPQVDLASAKNPYIDQMVEVYQKMGRNLYVLDLTTDLGIPVFASISYKIEAEKPQEILYAFGSHVEAAIALERAIIEMNQLLPISEKFKGRYRTNDPEFIDWLLNVRIEDHLYLQPKDCSPRNLQTDYPPLCPPTLKDAIHYCVAAAKERGMETLVLNLTQPDIGLPVVKVFVPGLRHFWRRTAPGRLYDVPLKMGWLNQAHTEAELNPLSIII